MLRNVLGIIVEPSLSPSTHRRQLAWSYIIVILSKSRQWIISLLLEFLLTVRRCSWLLSRGNCISYTYVPLPVALVYSNVFQCILSAFEDNEYLLYVVMMSISQRICISHPVHETNYLRSMASFVVPHPSILAALITSIATVTRLESSYFCTTVTCAMLPILLPSLPTLSLMRFTTWVLWVMSRCRLTCQR